MSARNRIVVITGGSKGIGLSTALAFQRQGDTVYVLSRTVPKAEGLLHIETDVTNPDACTNAAERITKEVGRIDVLILNAGSGVSGTVEHTSLSDAHGQFDVCFFGALHVLKPCLPLLRASKGIVLFLSSVAGVTPIPFQAFYSAAKAAVCSLVGALRNELSPHGVRVAAVLPGDVKTEFTHARTKQAEGSELYPALVRSVARMEHDEQNGMSPERIANKLVRLSKKRHPKPYCTVGIQYQIILVLMKVLPSRLSNWIIGLLYAK